MKKNLLLLSFIAVSLNSFSQILGNLVSIAPNTAVQGQTLVTTITEQSGTFMFGSPPCDNSGIYLQQGNTTIFCNSYNWIPMDMYDVEFTIPAAAPIGFYDVYVASAHYDWMQGTCTTLGYWLLSSGFEVTLANGIHSSANDMMNPVVSPNPFNENANIFFSNAEGKKYSLTVIDSHGRVVYQTLADSDHFALSRKNFYSGIYFYKLEGLENKISFTGKFVVTE